MSRWSWKAATVRTGRIVASDLPLTGVSAGCRLDFGPFSAQLPLHNQIIDDPDVPDRFARCRELLNATTPVLMTIVGIRDGKVMGEWLVWTRGPRLNGPDPVPLTGIEFGSWFSHVVVDGWTKLSQNDQLTVARALAQLAVDKPPGLSGIEVATAGGSGNLIETADYPTGTDFIGNIISELASAVNGFDWWVDSDWDHEAATPTIKRTVRFAYPRRGRRLAGRIDIPVRRSSSGVRFGLTEDGSRVATTVYMTGTGEGDKQLYSRGQNADLLLSYPVLEKIESRASYDVQSLLDAQTAAVAAASRSAEIPSTVQLLADGELQLGTYAPGDTLPAKVQPCANFPDGYATDVRILGYTMTPPSDGRLETVDVEIGRDDAGAFDT